MTIGSCLCGKVRFEVSGPYLWFAHCHCSMCRRHHGALYSSTLAVKKENFRWLSSVSDVVHYRSSDAFVRTFCDQCGSTLPDEGNPAFVGIPAGTLTADPETRPQAHIFVKSKSQMCDINDDLPQFEEYPPGYGSAVPAREAPIATEAAVSGSCLCGEVVYELDEVPTKIAHCHCTRCQRSRGTAHATNAFVRQEHLRWTRGADQVRTYKVPDAALFATSFCGTCGSLLPAHFAGIKRYNVPLGSLDRPLDAKPRLHIHVQSRAQWHSITDSLPQFEEMPPRDQVKEWMF